MPLLLFLLFSSASFAGERRWLICSNESLVLNVVEVPSLDRGYRDTEISFISGVNNRTAVISGKESGSMTDSQGFLKVWLEGENEGDPDYFDGKVKIDYSTPVVTVHGALWPPGDSTATTVDGDLECKSLR
jgi:hypothetical protein